MTVLYDTEAMIIGHVPYRVVVKPTFAQHIEPVYFHLIDDHRGFRREANSL